MIYKEKTLEPKWHWFEIGKKIPKVKANLQKILKPNQTHLIKASLLKL